MLKKAQISIFVIISIVVVFVGAFLFFNDNYNVFYSPENQMASDLRAHVDSCVKTQAEQGVFLLGFQGGYIEIPPAIENNPERRLVFSSNGNIQNNTMSMPNWDSELGGVPTRDSMEEELEEHISTNAQGCIESNFDAYSSNYNLNYSFENFSNQVTINDENVEVNINFPVKFNEIRGDIDSQIESSYVNLEDTPLGNLHSLAIEIYNLEQQTYVFEELVMDQIYSSGEESSEETSMPTEGMTFSCNPQIWTKTELKETLAELNNNNFKYLYFEGTRSIEERFSANLDGELEDLQDYYEGNYIHQLPSTKPAYQNYEVNVRMPTSRFTGSTGYFNAYPYRTFEVTPSDGEVVRPLDIDLGGTNIPIPCMQIFHHLYTLDYDLLVQLREYSDGEEGLLFQYPQRIEIEDNAPKEKPETSITPDEPTTATDENFCAQENRNTQATFYVQDVVSQEYLSGANVSYNCISLSCDVGETQKPTYGFVERTRPDAIPKINTTIGYCNGGTLEVEKEGYHQIGQDQRIVAGNSQKIKPVTAEMVPTKEFPVGATTLTATTYNSCQSDKRNEGQFYISVENQGYDFESQAFYPRTTQGYMDTITLLEKPNTPYNISIIYTKEGGEPYGLLEYENKVLDYERGNRLDIDIPIAENALGENNFINYFDDVENVLSNDYTCPGLSFGINIE